MRVLFGKDIVSKHYELLHYICCENQIFSRYLAEKLNYDFTLSLEDLFYLVMDKLDNLDPLDKHNEKRNLSLDNSYAGKTVAIKDYLKRKQKKIN